MVVLFKHETLSVNQISCFPLILFGIRQGEICI